MWFGVSLLFRDAGARADENALWEERILLVEAETDDGARSLAASIGRNTETEYVSATGDTVKWVLDRVGVYQTLTDERPNSGDEVFSRFLRASEVRSLLTPFG